VNRETDPIEGLRGNFRQLRLLKERYPGLKVFISVGGWTWSEHFSEVAGSETSRLRFVKSCLDLYLVQYGDAFDGVDLDWEYPVSGGMYPGRPEDKENYTLLVQEFRSQMNALQEATGRQYLLTIAAPAGKEQYSKMDLAGIAPHVDWVNVMTYDFHGGWETTGPTNHSSALFPSTCESPDGDWADKAIRAYLHEVGDPAKVVLGMPFFGHGWRTSNVPPGLCLGATGIPRGTYEKGVDDYEVLAARNAPPFSDEKTGTHWTFDGSTFWSFDDPESARWKADYANCRGLRGMMFWELSGDDPTGSLLTAMSSQLRNPGLTCHEMWPPLP
jgi:chitinase